MPTSRPFGYNPSQLSIPGVTNQGTLAINGPTDGDFAGSGINFWYMGPDEDVSGYIIAYVDAEGSHTLGDQGEDGTPGSEQAYVGFKRISGTDADFISVAAGLTGQSFEGNTAGEVATWLNDNGYWTNYPETEAPSPTTRAVTYFYAAVEACPPSSWTGLARSTQRLVRDGVYNVVDTGNGVTKVVVSNENAPEGVHDINVDDFTLTNCAEE